MPVSFLRGGLCEDCQRLSGPQEREGFLSKQQPAKTQITSKSMVDSPGDREMEQATPNETSLAKRDERSLGAPDA